MGTAEIAVATPASGGASLLVAGGTGIVFEGSMLERGPPPNAAEYFAWVSESGALWSVVAGDIEVDPDGGLLLEATGRGDEGATAGRWESGVTHALIIIDPTKTEKMMRCCMGALAFMWVVPSSVGPKSGLGTELRGG